MPVRTINRAAACAGIALIVAQSAGVALAAGGSRQSLGDALFTGPLVAPNATSLPQGHWDVEPYAIGAIQHGRFDNDWNSHYGVIVGADVVVAERNTADVVTPKAALNIFY